jgi:hypothetical protein
MTAKSSDKRGIAGEAANEQQSTERLSENRLYRVLRNIRRRYILYYLQQVRDPARIDDIVERIVDWENNGETVPTKRHKSVYNAVHQTHLPKLREVDLVEFAREGDSISQTEKARRIDLYPAPQTIAWERYYGYLSGIAVLLVGSAPFDAALSLPLEQLPWMEMVLLAFVVLSVGHAYDHFRWHQRFLNGGPDIIIDGDDTW